MENVKRYWCRKCGARLDVDGECQALCNGRMSVLEIALWAIASIGAATAMWIMMKFS